MASSLPIQAKNYLRDILECPVCLQIPNEGPVFQCQRGHIACNICHPKLKICPICRELFGSNRNFPLEKIYSVD